jgi:hypothetical protein
MCTVGELEAVELREPLTHPHDVKPQHAVHVLWRAPTHVERFEFVARIHGPQEGGHPHEVNGTLLVVGGRQVGSGNACVDYVKGPGHVRVGEGVDERVDEGVGEGADERVDKGADEGADEDVDE